MLIICFETFESIVNMYPADPLDLRAEKKKSAFRVFVSVRCLY